MPNLASLASVTQNRAKAAITFENGVVVHVEYYAGNLTTRMLADIAASSKLDSLKPDRVMEVITGVTKTLTALVAEWDLTLTDADGAEVPMPITEEAIGQLAMTVQWRILNGLLSGEQTYAGEAVAAEEIAPASAAS